MAKINVGDTVYVPVNKMKKDITSSPNALYKGEVLEVANRSIKIKLPDGTISKPIGSSMAYKNEDIGIFIIMIGDMQTEEILLRPLKKSILQYCRLVVDHETFVYAVECRSKEELGILLKKHGNSYKNIILIGHGFEKGICFGVDRDVEIDDVIQIFAANLSSKKSVISLCCKTGFKSFGEKFSNASFCSEFIAPFHSVHGAIASQFTQTYIANHILEGYTKPVSFKKTVDCIPGKTSFRLWVNGKLKKSKER